jgi:hypothetical protein
MRIRPARLLFAFAVGLGCSAVFTFPSWSSGMVRGGEQGMGLEQTALPRLVIESKRHSLTVTVPGKTPVVMKAQGAYALKAGSRAVVAKELDPVWNAPPTYFLRRGLAVPEKSSAASSLRGALGHQALVLTGDLTLHSGPIWNDDVGGVRVSPQDMAMLFDMVPVGTVVEVR